MIAVVDTEPANAQDWYAHVLGCLVEQRRPLKTLILSGDPGALAALGVTAACSVRLGCRENAPWHTVHCRDDELPFQDGAFDLVVLHDWVDQGDERSLAAVRRALPGGGQLLVFGRGRFSTCRLRAGGRSQKTWRPGWLCRRLRFMGFQPRDLRGRGVLGLDQPTGRGWRRSLLACSDRVAVRARRSDGRADIRLVRFSRPRAAVGGSAAWDGVRRESSQ